MREGEEKALIVGTGFGSRIQVPAFRGAGFDVVGLVGTDAQRTATRAEQNDVAGSFTNLGDAIDETGARVVAVSAPPHVHAALVIEALERGCHVLCEKPFALERSEAERMLEAARRAGTVHFLGNEFRFQPQRALVARAIAEGLIGRPVFATLVQYSGYVASFEQDIPDWWFDPACGGGWLGASGSHAIDQVRSWLGEFASVSATLSRVSATRGPIDDSFSVRFTLQNGVEGVVQQSAGAYGPYGDLTRVAGTEGTIWTDGETVHLAGPGGDRVLDVPDDLRLPAPPKLGGDPRHDRLEWQIMAAAEIAPYTQLCRSLRAAIAGETAPSPVRPATFEDGVANMAVMDAIRASAESGGTLQPVTL